MIDKDVFKDWCFGEKKELVDQLVESMQTHCNAEKRWLCAYQEYFGLLPEKLHKKLERFYQTTPSSEYLSLIELEAEEIISEYKWESAK